MTGQWISASEARELACPGWNQNGGPTDGICDEAKVGRVVAKAAIYVENRSGGKIEHPMHPVPSKFWAGGNLDQEWGRGKFSAWIIIDGYETLCEAFGVEFEKSGIDAISPISSSSVKSPPNRQEVNPSVERPKKHDWEGALISIVVWANGPDGLPTGYGAQAEIERRMAEWFQDNQASEPSKSEIRKRAARIMNEVELAKQIADASRL